VVFMNHYFGPDPAHALLIHIVDNNLKRINLKRFKLLVKFFNGNAEPNQSTKDHIPARPADTFKMQCLFAHNAREHGRFWISRQAAKVWSTQAVDCKLKCPRLA